MGTTTFSGPIKAGDIYNTTGTTVGTNVRNVGQVVMAQSAIIDIIGASANTAVAVVPANSQIIDVILNVVTANNDSNAAAVTVGITGNTNAFFPSTSVKSVATTHASALEVNATDVGTTDVQVNAYFTATDGNGSTGNATVTVVYLQANNLVA
jgi:hypothetical protein